MFTTISVNKISPALIGILFALCLLSMVGCGGGAISSVHSQDLRQRVINAEDARDGALKRAETAETAKVRAETARDSARRRTKAVETERDRARRRAETAEDAMARVEDARDRARRRAETAEDAMARVEDARDKALRRAKIAEDAVAGIEVARDRALRRAKAAESAISRVESERDRALRRAKAAEVARDRALRRAETAEKAKVRAETARDTARRRVKAAEEELANLQELVSLVPQATIKNASIDPKRKSMDIWVEFSIKNRKDIEGWVYVYFYFEDEKQLADKNGNPISIKQEFTPKSVIENLRVKLPMSYDKLNLGQPDRLMFSVRIYDKSTDSFLNKKRYLVGLSYDSSKSPPVRLTGR